MSFVPYVIEQTSHGERSYDIFSRLLKDRIIFLGEEVTVRSFLGEYSAQAVDVDGEGRLIVRREDGALEALNSGEISIRLQRKN